MTPNSMWIGVGVALVIIALVVLFGGSRITGNYVRGRVGGDVNQTYSSQGTQASAPEKSWITAVSWLIAIIGVAVSAYGVFGKK
jgi:hypothetical protein